MDNIILSFDKDGFRYATERHKEKSAKIDAIKFVAKKELDLTIEVTDSRTLKENIYKAVEKKYKKENTLNLTGAKLVELMQIDLNPIFNLTANFNEFDAFNLDNEPTKEMYMLTVDNDAEMNRYNHALKVIDLIEVTRTLTNNVLEAGHYYRLFSNVIKQNAAFDGFEPLPSFVKKVS